MNKATIRGVEAVIRWGYHSAVRLGPWTVDVDATQRTLSGKVIESDTFKASQQPLTFVVSRPQGQAWCWPVESLQIAAGEVHARLGPQE